MIVYPQAYIDENEKLENTPATIVEIVTDGIEDGTTPDRDLDINGSPTATVSSGVGHATLDTVRLLTGAGTSQAKWFARQSFKMPTFRSANITSLDIWVAYPTVSFPVAGVFATILVQIFEDESLTVALTSERETTISTILYETAALATISFSGEEFLFIEGITYYLKIRATSTNFTFDYAISVAGTPAGGYADGELYSQKTDSIVGDSDFAFSLGTLHDNYITPTVVNFDLDIGEIPPSDGEWTIKDTAEDGASVTYTAVSDDNAGFTSPTALGTIIDGDAITVLERYYRITATLVTTIPHNTSTVLQIKADFEIILIISDTTFFGHEPSLKTVSTITKTIDDFQASTIGQLSFTTDYTASIRDFIETKFPKGNTVRFKRGFVVSGYSTNDFIDHYLGRIENWIINGNDTVTFILKDFQRDLSTKIPIITADGATTDIEYTAEHPVSVMLDIIQDRVGIRTSKVDVDSFNAVITALSGWTVTRNAANNTALVEPEEAQKLLEELRIITNTYFIPQNDGKIVLKQWNSSEASVRTFLEHDFLLPALSVDANLPALFNFVLIYYDWDGEGNNPSDFAQGSGSVDATSLANWGLTEIKQLKDKWTLAAQTSQIETTRDNLQNRYKDPPQLVSSVVDSRNSDLEVGDIIKVSHSRLSRQGSDLWVADFGGFSNSLPVNLELLHVFLVGGVVVIAGGNNGSASIDTVYTTAAGDSGFQSYTEVATLPDIVQGGAFLQTNDSLYIFGGFSTVSGNSKSTIYLAGESDLTSWSSSGSIPEVNTGSSIVEIQGKLYLYGGKDGTTFRDKIYTSTSADPTSWATSGNTLPVGLAFSSVVVIENFVYLLGGKTATTTYTDSIYRAPLSDPTDWEDTGETIPAAVSDSLVYKTDDYVYLVGGETAASTTTDLGYKAPLSSPFSWVTAGGNSFQNFFPVVHGSMRGVRSGDVIYSLGGNANGTTQDRVLRSDIEIEKRNFQIVSTNPTTRNKINLKLLGMGV